jgi:hypothetical protein
MGSYGSVMAKGAWCSNKNCKMLVVKLDQLDRDKFLFVGNVEELFWKRRVSGSYFCQNSENYDVLT